MSLPKRSLGSSGVPITVTGFGAWALGGGGWAYGWGPQDDNQSILTIRHAWSMVLTGSIPPPCTAWVIPRKVVGRLLRELPASERPMVFTKCGLVWDEQQSHGGAATSPQARIDSQGMRCIPTAARRGVH